MSRILLYRLRYILLDSLAMLLTILLFNILRYNMEEVTSAWGGLGSYLLNLHNLTISALVWVAWMAIFALSGYYNKPVNKSRIDELWTTLCSVFVGSVVSFLFWVVDDVVLNTRVYLELFAGIFFLAFFWVYMGRLCITLWGIRKREDPEHWEKVLLVGTRQEVEHLVQCAKTMRFVERGRVLIDEESTSASSDVEHLSHKIASQFFSLQPTAIYLSASPEWKSVAGHLLYSMYRFHCPIYIEAESVPLSQPRPKLTHTILMGVPMIEVTETNMSELAKNLKSCSDRLASLFALLLLSPLLLVLSIAVRRSSSGPVFYRQERIGKRGKPFFIYKFRTMYTNTEGETPQLSFDGDPRVTPLGRWLRRYRLDELPQLYNVLRGDMSFVGPRPERQYYIDQIVEHAPYYSLLHNVLPGITSWGMVRYGYASTLEEMLERLRYDWLYYENMSLKLDLVVLFYTIRTILNGEGK